MHYQSLYFIIIRTESVTRISFRFKTSARERSSRQGKNVFDNFPHLDIITKSATPGKVQITFVHETVGNKSLRESTVAFALAGNLDSPYFASINMEISFATDGDKIRLPVI